MARLFSPGATQSTPKPDSFILCHPIYSYTSHLSNLSFYVQKKYHYRLAAVISRVRIRVQNGAVVEAGTTQSCVSLS